MCPCAKSDKFFTKTAILISRRVSIVYLCYGVDVDALLVPLYGSHPRPLPRLRGSLSHSGRGVPVTGTTPAPRGGTKVGKGVVDWMEVTPEYKIRLVRELRRRQTRSEARLWEQLRARRLGGLKFRRQRPIGRFIADFCCEEARLVVEVDGPIHNLPEQRNHDEERAPCIEGRGYLILRVSNTDVMTDLWSVLDRIRQAAAVPFTDSLDPSRGAGVVPVTGTPRPEWERDLRRRGRGRG